MPPRACRVTILHWKVELITCQGAGQCSIVGFEACVVVVDHTEFRLGPCPSFHLHCNLAIVDLMHSRCVLEGFQCRLPVDWRGRTLGLLQLLFALL